MKSKKLLEWSYGGADRQLDTHTLLSVPSRFSQRKFLVKCILSLKLCDFGLAFGDTPMVHQVYKLVKWIKPQPLFYKLNSDGSCIEEGMCGVGGVIRDSNGHMILVFSVFQGPGTSNWAKEPATLYA
ncbi:hypothetical protein H5410_025506 [Solanum commersonii]|uniref:RNase H type-1 domain-containing protein n=1 Tax=Solanum commersonii TaxID=4109 RepID=A0A9J5YYQ0_SOLCO|nr:hypothetical protein H5410_025506 [Solanum commersonii]